MNSDESIHTIFSNVIDKWSENFKKDMDPLLKVVDNIHMKNSIINEILKSMPEYKLLEEYNKKLIIENLELKNKLQNNITLPEDSKEVELCISDYEILETNNNIDSVENPDNIIINNSEQEDKKNQTEEQDEESDEEESDEEEKTIIEQREPKDEESQDEKEETELDGEEEKTKIKQEEPKDEESQDEEGESEEEEGESEEEEEEVFLVEIQGKNYYTDSEKNGTIYQYLDDEDIGDKVGIFDKNGVAIFD